MKDDKVIKNTDEGPKAVSKITEKSFKNRIDNLPYIKRQAVLDGIAEGCGVTIGTVYRWLKDESQIGKLEREKIEQLIEI